MAVDRDYDLNTADVFSEKWAAFGQEVPDEDENWKRLQFAWYLRCYGYASDAELAAAIGSTRTILDAGCGLGYKAAWLAGLSPASIVVAMDISNSIYLAASRYAHVPNLLFVQGDIADTSFRDDAFDFVSCDQVLHHTVDPPATVKEFARILAPGGTLNTYVYARKALPRELLDEHMREYSKTRSREELWELSDQLTRLGKLLTDLEITIDVPDMPLLGIPGGKQDLQRFIYWNFIKCFWNPEFGHEASKMTNFDWYAPSTAFRYTREQFCSMIGDAGFEPQFLHSEEACHTGRFRR